MRLQRVKPSIGDGGMPHPLKMQPLASMKTLLPTDCLVPVLHERRMF